MRITERPSVPVFRIHDILVWIRILIRGSMPLTDPDADSDLDADPDLQDVNKKQILRLKVQKSHKTIGIKVFLTIFA
jgi:hypothetical protein